ncbi:MAG: glucuronate isomerase, partial [Planctomycetaceae bacterium]|nr:glucuronate isomerase [Planctomycetaceae bacterium]
MSQSLAESLFQELEQIVLIDPHTHINPHSAPSQTLADIMGYHYYTELAHSAGLPKDQIEQEGLDPKEKVGRLVGKLADLDNTIQVSWLLDICREFFGFTDDRLTPENWESVYDSALEKMAQPDWEKQVLDHSKLEKVFLTNDFDDPLEGFDTNLYIPCLRTDDLVFHFTKKAVQQRLEKATEIEVHDVVTMREAIGKLFAHFCAKGAKACAISIPPSFQPMKCDPGAVSAIIKRANKQQKLTDAEQAMLSAFAFWTITEFCAEHKLPFDLMIGVNRRVYEDGVFQGQDLFDKRVSLIQYKELFNAFPQVTFPISVLGSTSNQELVSYA